MFDTFDGLPVHALVVHAVVVLLPLGVLGTIAIAVKPAWRRTYGWLVVGVIAVGTALVPVAMLSGEEFKKRVGDPGNHDNLGKQLIWFALALLILVVLLVLLDAREVASGAEAGSTTVTVLAVLAVLAAVACGIQVYRIGESGARAAWGAVVEGTNP